MRAMITDIEAVYDKTMTLSHLIIIKNHSKLRKNHSKLGKNQY